MWSRWSISVRYRSCSSVRSPTVAPGCRPRVALRRHRLGGTDAGDPLRPPGPRRLDDEVAGPDDPLQDPLMEPDVVDPVERDLHRRLRDPALPVDDPLVRHDEVRRDPSDEPPQRIDHEQHDPGPEDDPAEDALPTSTAVDAREAKRLRADDEDRHRDRPDH